MPAGPMHFGWIRFLETRGKGSFDHKRTGTEMTNGKGMNCLKNFPKVTSALLAMFDPGSREHAWLSERIGKWEALAKALYEVYCFFKSKKEGSGRV